MSMRFDLAGECETVNFVVVCAPADCTKDAELKRVLW